MPRHNGFTLIELSIVLVIIGLIVGGILVGQDLIKAASIRTAIGQIEKYDAAVNTFRTKYNALPGDLSNASTFGMTSGVSATASPAVAGNKVVESCTSDDGLRLGCENKMFWNHMSSANLIEGAFTNTANDTDFVDGVAANLISSVLPASKIGKGNYIHIQASGGLNHYRIAGITSVGATGGTTIDSNALTPLEAFQMDNKMDDGNPTHGIVVARAVNGIGLNDNTPSTYTSGNCLASATAYSTDDADATSNLCQLRIRASF